MTRIASNLTEGGEGVGDRRAQAKMTAMLWKR